MSDKSIGSPAWSSPERLQCKTHGMPSDVFSFAVVAWECLTTERPWAEHESVVQIITAVIVNQKRHYNSIIIVL